MRTTTGILSLLMIFTLAGCSSDDNPSVATAMTVRVDVLTNPVGCSSDVFWVSTPEGMTGNMMGMTSAQTTDPVLIAVGTTIDVLGQISCSGPGSHGGVEANIQVMVNGNWQDAGMTGTSSCSIDDGPGGCTFEFTSDFS